MPDASFERWPCRLLWPGPSTPWPLANEVGIGDHRPKDDSYGRLDRSMALGAVEVSPMEAFAPFSNIGFLGKGYGIARIRTVGAAGGMRHHAKNFIPHIAILTATFVKKIQDDGHVSP